MVYFLHFKYFLGYVFLHFFVIFLRYLFIIMEAQPRHNYLKLDAQVDVKTYHVNPAMFQFNESKTREFAMSRQRNIRNQPIRNGAFQVNSNGQVNGLCGKNSEVMLLHKPSKEIPRTKCQEKGLLCPFE